ncbi:hypothetical protein FGW37_15730 [Streptomyces rectiverticillatus]|uniref:hypothetical protein n=1 Tax=Streptomyces rectiverticillatus TaxID=173860 RepID=UPI0015C3E7C4|nr:hypothetical protein [Streptomyces rectiverticillatus]QLE72843.1 hypothetical protein FGW37_15730 [Streptomyces rectiverticillatus]
MKRRVAAVAATAAAAVLVVTGCSSSSKGKEGDKPGEKPGSAGERQAQEYREAAKKDRAKMLEVAVAYQKARSLHDGDVSCRMLTEQGRSLRGSSHEACVKFLKPLDGDVRKTVEAASFSVTGDPVDVPPIGDHPAGTGVMVTEESKPDGHTSYQRTALRMVKVKGTWLVDQDEDVQDSEMRHSSPVFSALMRSH